MLKTRNLGKFLFAILMKHNHILVKSTLGLCVIALILVCLAQLPKLSDVQMFGVAQIQEKLIPYQQETAIARENAEKQRLIAEQWESNTRAVKAQQEAEIIKEQTRIKIEHIPQRDLIALGWGWALIVSFCTIMLCLGIGLTIAIVRFTTLHSDVFALALVSKRLTPGQERLELEKLRYLREELKVWGISKDAPMLTGYKDITPPSTEHTTALQSLNQGLMSGGNPSFFLGVNQATHEPEMHDLLEDATGIKVGGKQKKGKTNTLKLVAIQSLIKGWRNIWIDLHNPAKKSFVVKMGELADFPQIKIFSNKEEAIQSLYFLDMLLDARLRGTGDTVPVLIVVDEILNLMNLLRKDGIDASETFKRINTEGGQLGIIMIAAAHTWTGEEVGSTGFRDSFDFTIAHKMTPLQAGTFGITTKHWKDQCDHLQPGDVVMMDSAGELKPVHMPLWTPEAIQKAHGMIRPHAWPDMQKPTQEDLNEYACNVIQMPKIPTDEEILEHLHTLLDRGMKQKEIASRSGMSENTISAILQGRSQMQSTTKRKLMEVGS